MLRLPNRIKCPVVLLAFLRAQYKVHLTLLSSQLSRLCNLCEKVRRKTHLTVVFNNLHFSALTLEWSSLGRKSYPER